MENRRPAAVGCMIYTGQSIFYCMAQHITPASLPAIFAGLIYHFRPEGELPFAIDVNGDALAGQNAAGKYLV